jgi:hypothetical protein
MLSNEKIIFKNLNHRINDLVLLNEAYQKQLAKYEDIFNNLESQIHNLKVIRQNCNLKEEIYQNEKLEIIQKDQKILELQTDIINLKIEHERYKNKKEMEYENDVNAVKNFYDTNLLKNNTAQVVEEANKQFYQQILKLENIIINFKEEQRKLDIKKEIEFERRMSKMKKKMLDYIKEGQKSKQYLSKEQLRLNDKLSVINKNTLLNELDFQSMQLEDLLKQRAQLDSIISGMKSDLEIHKKLEKILTEKNKEYTNMIKVLSTKIESKGKVDEMNENLESKDTLKKELSSKLKQFRLVKPNSKFIRINNQNNIRSLDKRENKVKSESNNIKQNFNEEIKIKNFGKTSVGFRNNLKDDDINENQDLVFLRKELIKKIKESEDYRSKFEYYKTKLDLINKKYGNIMQLFEGVLVNIYEDKNMKYIKNIFINLEDFKQCNFETLSSEQKYSIVLLIIKYLMPLINPHNLPYKFKSLFSNVDDVTFINEKTEKGNYLLSSTSSYVSSNYKEKSNRHIAVKSRIKSSSSDFGKTQLFFDNKYHKQLNNLYSSTNVLNSNENTLTRNKKPKNKEFLKFLSRESSEKSLGTFGFGYKYGALLKNFFTSLEADSFNNNKLEKGYSLFNV